MITKQQALEFLYELSKEFKITINLIGNCGSFIEVYSDTSGTFHFNIEADSLEELVTKFIANYINTNLFENIDKIPVDIDMLEEGQTYKVHAQTDWEHRYFTEKFLGFDEEDNYVLKFENSKCNKLAEISKYDIREIYKMNNDNQKQ